VLTIALLLALFTTKQYSALSLASGLLATASVSFLLGSRRRRYRIWWRTPEQARCACDREPLTFAESPQEVASRVLERLPASSVLARLRSGTTRAR
jgi:hypothetical protein